MTKSKTRNQPAAAQTMRCAIYTRKSTDEGLDQEFNSLDAQRESGEAYVASQQHEGWTCIAEHYDDGGFSGGNMERPALKRLMADIEAGKIDSVIVYKVDRLSRSLLDFAKIVEAFEVRAHLQRHQDKAKGRADGLSSGTTGLPQLQRKDGPSRD